MALLSPPPKHQFFGDDGLPLSGGLVYTYEKDTTAPLATYTDSTGSVANANPIVLDGQGRASIWFQILPYSLVIHNSLGELQSCSGPVEFPPSATSGSDIAAWSDIVVYNFPDQVAGSDGYTYRCVGTNNLDDDPVSSTSGEWINLSSVASVNLTGTPTCPTADPGTETTQIANCAFVAAAIAGVIPIGVIFPFSMETVPTGFLKCNGAAVSRTTYANLFAVIGDDYGAGDGSTTFNLPDMRGRFLRGMDNGAGVDPDAASRTDRGDGTTGDHVGTKQADQIKSHLHSVPYSSGALQTAGLTWDTPCITGPYTTNTNLTGGNETRPININVMYCIKY